jgi:hypothetical protein
MSGGTLRGSQVRALVHLVNEAHELKTERAARPRHLLTGVCRILGADAGACVMERDFRPGGHGGFTAVVLEGWGGSAVPALDAPQRLGSACNPAIRSLMEQEHGRGGSTRPCIQKSRPRHHSPSGSRIRDRRLSARRSGPSACGAERNPAGGGNVGLGRRSG